jgi:hypothetical protein
MQNKSQVGGILAIISGALGVIGSLVMITMIIFMRCIFTSPEFGVGPEGDEVFTIIFLVYGIIGFVLLILGVTGIVGGIYAMKRRLWGLALAGAICGIITFLPTGVIGTVFIAQAQKEFSSSNPIDIDARRTGDLPQS